MALLGYCGALDARHPIGHLLVPQDYVDFTRDRPRSLIADLLPDDVFFYRMADPYSPSVRRMLLEAGSRVASVHEIGSYAVTDGPRFEASAEVRILQHIGASAVCFSGAPDASICRELGLHSGVGLFAVNYGEGMEASGLEAISEATANVYPLITDIIMYMLDNPWSPSHADSTYHEQYWTVRPSRAIDVLLAETSSVMP